MYEKGECMELSKDELMNIYGGSAKVGFLILIGGILTLIVGIIDGYLRPLKCNKWS